MVPRWSPGGRYIDALKADSQQLVVFDFTTGQWQPLTDFPVIHHSWSRGGTTIYFLNYLSADTALFRVGMSDHKIERLASLKEFRAPSEMNWGGVAPDDSPLLLRDVGTREIYAFDCETP